MIEICDIGPRDGLLKKATSLSFEQRLELVQRPVGAGLLSVEVTRMANNCMQDWTCGRLVRGKDHSL